MIRFILKFIFLSFLFLLPVYSEVIENISVEGNKRISPSTIIILGEIKINTEYNEKKLNDLVKKLYDTEFFKDISVDLTNNLLNIKVTENPIVEDIIIDGVKRESIKEFLLEQIALKKRKSFSEIILQNDINLIKNILKTNGYYFVEVNHSIKINEKLNSISLLFNIIEGPRAKIKKIKFIGDKKIKSKKLLEIIASDEHKFWKFLSNNIYIDQSRINLDVRLIENYYKNLGYYNVKVLDSFATVSNDGFFDLIYTINAGDLLYFNDLTLNLPPDYNVKDFDKIKKKMNILKGEKYSLNEFNQILSEIEMIASLRLYDFIDAKVQQQIIDNNKINFIFNVRDATNYYVEKINISGNYNTIEEVVRNQLIVDEGDPFNDILFNKSIDNIRSLGIFKNVKSNIKDGSSLNLKEIDISVEEMPTGEISLAAGVGTSGTTIGGGITEKNFLGKGINLRSNIEISESSIKGQFTYSKPNFAYTDNTLSTSIFSTTTDNLSDFGYKVSEIGLSVGTSYEKFENLFFSPTIKSSFEDLETNSSASNSLKRQNGTYNDIYFNYGVNYDLRNSKYKPSSGNQSSFYQELPLVSNSSEIVNIFNYNQFHKLSNESDMIGKASFYLKTVNSINSDKDVRISKRGNIPYNRLRGFEKGKIGPVENNDYIGGNYVSSLNLSTNLPFMFPSIEIADFSFFVDAANVWGVDYDSNLDDSNYIRSSTGLALNLITPVGPLSFSLSQPISKKSTDKTESFRFNLGTSF
jgi:outer membrane protein insertion porin family